DDLPDMYVYMIREPSTGNIKIGISQDPERRLRQLQTGNSSKLELVACAKAENRYEDEMNLHRMVKNMLVRGEWFATGNAYTKELHKRLEEIGMPDALEVAARKTGCPAHVVIFDDAVYDYAPSSTERHPSLESYLNSFDSAAIAEDLGCDISEVCCPLEYSIDLRGAKERASHVVQAIGVIGGDV
ncbi:MAG TPA: GIY-YIG nuclease family protein, partial [Thiopseudomonas sp.]|nr:GIY-YIG nuclease family protein [Thiopseudomonas sp.]